MCPDMASSQGRDPFSGPAWVVSCSMLQVAEGPRARVGGVGGGRRTLEDIICAASAKWSVLLAALFLPILSGSPGPLWSGAHCDGTTEQQS